MALFSPLSSLLPITKDNNKSTVKIGKLLSKNIEKKRNLSSSINLFKKRRSDFEKRSILRDKLITPKLITNPKSSKALALNDKSLSISDRLLGFIGYLSSGWILSNMPTWIAYGKQFNSRLITVGSILKNYGDETLEVMNGITNVFGSALTNISKFDFTDDSFLLKNSLDNLKDKIDDLSVGLDEAFNVLLKPFKDIPELGTIQPDEPTKTPNQTPPSGVNADFWTLVAVVSREDSDPQGQADVAQSIYNRASSGAYGSKNIRELILRKSQYAPTWEFPKFKSQQTPNKEWYQITDAQSAATATGLDVGTIQNVARNITNPTAQKKAAEFVQGRTDFKGAKIRFPGSIQRKPGDNNFGWQYGYNGKSVSPIPNFVLNSITPPITTQKLIPPPNTDQRRLRPGDIFTKSLSKDVDFIEISDTVGSPRGKGRHGGIDIAAPYGTYIALRYDCEVVASGTYGNYGLLIDVWIPSKGIQLRMAHLSSILIKSGKIPTGTSFARVGKSGSATGPHIHLEYDTKKGATRGGGALNDDPKNYAANLDQYVRLLLLTKNPNKGQFTPTPKPSTPLVPLIQLPEQNQAEIETNSYLNQIYDTITQERQGRKIIVIDDRNSSFVQQIDSSSGDDGVMIKIPESVLLNRFMKNKLLLDLNYL